MRMERDTNSEGHAQWKCKSDAKNINLSGSRPLNRTMKHNLDQMNTWNTTYKPKKFLTHKLKINISILTIMQT